jgi:hypothetical protein
MKKWLEFNAKALQAAAAIITMLAAVAALAGVKVQIDANARQQREQSARDIYREYLNLSISKPELSHPDYCAIRGTTGEDAYEDYVEYMLYTDEQILKALPDWETTLQDRLMPHRELLCSESDWTAEATEVKKLVSNFRSKQCEGFESSCK